ncbi:hypothetical protein ACJW31_05G042000 [Castanea mollissima]
MGIGNGGVILILRVLSPFASENFVFIPLLASSSPHYHRSTPQQPDPPHSALRIYGFDLILQERGILLKLPEAVPTGQKVAASCLWLASKLEESPRKARQVLIVFHRMECRMENLPIEHLEIGSQKYHDLKNGLSRTERRVLKEMGFVCLVEHPHKFISNYLAILETPPELRQKAWNLANDRSMEDGTDRTKPWQLSEIVDAVQRRLVTMPEGTDSSSKVVRLLYANSGLGVLALGSNSVHKLWKWARNERFFIG